jgi:6-phosphogluconolactonase (cycloisomerase 2 family)
VLSNSPAGNAVVAFDRHADGSLVPAGTFATGGLGSGAGLGSQGAIIISDDHRLVFVVNAGSATISSFRKGPDGLALADQVPSGGTLPTSLAYRHGLLYVLNAGTPNQLAGFTVSAHGRMTPIPGSTRPLSAAQTAPAQVGFSTDGDTLIVTERATNVVDTYRVDELGLLDGPYVHPSAGPTPFGFALNHRGTLLVSEAGAGGGASTYRVQDGNLAPASSMLMTGQRAACWAVITTNGRFGYVSNAGTGNISGFALDEDGTASLLNADGVTAVTGGNPTDMSLSQDGRLLYVRVQARNEIVILSLEQDGALTTLPFAAAIPAGAGGLAAY